MKEGRAPASLKESWLKMRKTKKRQLKTKAGFFIIALFVSIPCLGWLFKSDLPLVSDIKIPNPLERTVVEADKPRKFRSTSNDFLGQISSLFNKQGLTDLNMSGSSQFTRKQLEAMVHETVSNNHLTPNQFVLVDLRQESHLFINGYPVSFFSPNFSHNWGQSSQQTEAEENDQQEKLSKKSEVTVHYVIEKGKKGALGKTYDDVEAIHQAQTEATIAKQLGIQYARFAVSDHMRPNDEIVDQFVEFVTNLPKNTWLHFHCRGGSGRTSTFMTMYDMLRNGKNLGKEDILTRQIALGGKDLYNINSAHTHQDSSSVKRERFIDEFYTYVQAEEGLGFQTWSAWARKKGIS